MEVKMTAPTRLGIGVIAVGMVMAVAGLAAAVDLGQLDDFDDGTVMGWVEGAFSPNPPVNVPDGGPLGIGDAYLENSSDGGFGVGSRMVMFNNAQWTGNYNALGTDLAIRADMANFGTDLLLMRVALEGANGARYSSSAWAVLQADDVWYEVVFDLTDAAMTLVEGSGTLDSVLDNVVEMRILSSTAPSWRGDDIPGILGVDNIGFRNLIFEDDFESGGVSNWSSSSP